MVDKLYWQKLLAGHTYSIISALRFGKSSSWDAGNTALMATSWAIDDYPKQQSHLFHKHQFYDKNTLCQFLNKKVLAVRLERT